MNLTGTAHPQVLTIAPSCPTGSTPPRCGRDSTTTSPSCTAATPPSAGPPAPSSTSPPPASGRRRPEAGRPIPEAPLTHLHSDKTENQITNPLPFVSRRNEIAQTGKELRSGTLPPGRHPPFLLRCWCEVQRVKACRATTFVASRRGRPRHARRGDEVAVHPPRVGLDVDLWPHGRTGCGGLHLRRVDIIDCDSKLAQLGQSCYGQKKSASPGRSIRADSGDRMAPSCP